MKALAGIISLLICFNLGAQNNDNTLQQSLNNALNKDKFNIDNLQANLDPAKNVVQLTWSSKPESNTNTYTIQKSSDKLEWKDVATIYGAGHKNHTMDYFHLDYSPTENLSHYRIVQKEKDGSERLSNVVPVNHVIKDGNMAGTNLSPILGEDKMIVNIAFEEVFEKEILLVMRDKKGDEFFSKVVINIEDEKLVAVPIEKEIPKGDYLITATSENQIYSQNIVVK